MPFAAPLPASYALNTETAYDVGGPPWASAFSYLSAALPPNAIAYPLMSDGDLTDGYAIPAPNGVWLVDLRNLTLTYAYTPNGYAAAIQYALGYNAGTGPSYAERPFTGHLTVWSNE